MQNRLQNTVAKPIQFRGRGLFHGIEATTTLLPADSDTGIVFRRTDLAGSPEIPACCESITSAPRRTVLQSAPDVQVETVEHLMAALAGLNIDNCVVEIDAPEIPAYDGSCRDFCDGILNAGLQRLNTPVLQAYVDGVTSLQSANLQQSLVLRPYLHSCLAITYHLDYGPRAPIAPQMLSVELDPETFLSEVAAARTFVLESEIKALRQQGYGKHLTEKDIVIVRTDGTVDSKLRWSNEGVRHKMLDCIGDMALSQRTFAGHVTACRSGHLLNHQMAKKLSKLSLARSVAEAA